MRKNIFLYLIITILISSSLVEAVKLREYEETKIDLDNSIIKIQNAINENNAEWIADYSSYYDSSFFVKNYEFGIDNEYQDDLDYLNNLPDSFDWRNVNNTNWVTSVKNQGSCGSCTAFGTLGALETVVQIELGQVVNIDLSEADLYYCNGGDCFRGLSIQEAAQYVTNIGVSDELCFPYTTFDGSCDDKSPNWNDRVIKAKSKMIQGITAIKNAIYQYGAVVSAFIVFEDFNYYSEGIYEHVYGNALGGHSITIVGWNDEPGYWICKNSWGRGWGEKNPYADNDERGYFRIKYDECGIGEDTHYFYDFIGNIPPSKPMNLKPYDQQNDVDINMNISWIKSNDSDGDEINYNVYFKKGLKVDLDDILINGLKNNFYSINNLNKETHYSWFIIAEDEHGSQTISDKNLFKTRKAFAPIIQGPSIIKINKNITYSAYPSDLCLGDEYIWEFNWGDDSNTILGPFDECVEISASHIWTINGKYSIGVRYKEDKSWSNWSYLDISIIKIKNYNFPIKDSILYNRFSFLHTFFQTI
jgi:C1A family cysteine protease